ncbi:hypothetical protein FUAX_54650 (plasmid) [Fulvitalea axinellae]|uniref:Uncharacterized protein n=1 Tax=Fulvitalea axinellae TaxID=1182444 RepID=A0AAU9CSE6_9BACT|nr:hypothetical protein FUAX_54650 [Fulvitalea axinellae]
MQDTIIAITNVVSGIIIIAFFIFLMRSVYYFSFLRRERRPVKEVRVKIGDKLSEFRSLRNTHQCIDESLEKKYLKTLIEYQKISENNVTPLYRFQPYAEAIKVFLQMLVGFAIVFLIFAELFYKMGVFEYTSQTFYLFNESWIVKLVTDNSELEDLIKQPMLTTVAIGLATATGIELAYMLFTPGPDEAIQPVTMGVAALILAEIGKPDFEFTIDRTFSVVLLAMLIPIFLWVEHWFKNKDEKKE